MEFMIDRRCRTYERSLAIWPVDKPGSSQSKNDVDGEVTRAVFADAIGGVISVWLSI